MGHWNHRRILLALTLFTLGTLSFTPRAVAQSPFTWGYNGFGQLGEGTQGSGTDRALPNKLSTPANVALVSAGYNHSLTVNLDGTVWAWGQNTYGQLGDGTQIDRTTPVPIAGLTGVVSVSAGGGHSLALRSDGTVWAWGINENYEIGDGTNVNRSVPVQVSGLSNIVQVAAGHIHSLALRADGTVWAWGSNAYGTLGDGTSEQRTTPVQVLGLSNVVEVSAGMFFSVVLKSDGTVWAWGRNQQGQLGDGTGTESITPVQTANLSGIIAISAKATHALAIKSDKTVWAWGTNSYGELGDGTNTNRFTPVSIAGLSDVAVVSAGYYHSLVLKTEGTLFGFGLNISGQLGDGTKQSKNTPSLSTLKGMTVISANGNHSMAVNTSRTSTVAVPNQTYPYGATTLVAQVTLGKTGFPYALRKVTFKVDETVVGEALTNANGVASLSCVVSGGKHKLTVTSPAKGRLHAGSGRGTLIITATNLNLKAESAKVRLGETAQLKATLTQKPGGSPVANKTLSFTLGETSIGEAVTDKNGKATLPYKADLESLVGKHKVIVSFNGDANYTKKADVTSLTVERGVTQLSQGDLSGTAATALNLNATLARSSDAKALANRTVTFYVGGVKVGVGTTDATGVATLGYTLPKKAGKYALKVVFVGDSAYLKCHYDKATLTVK